MNTRFPWKHIATVGVLLVFTTVLATEVLAGPTRQNGKGSTGSSSKQSSKQPSGPSSGQLKVPVRNVGALKATFDGRHDASNRALDTERSRRSQRLSRPDRVTATNASNELMENGETSTSPRSTVPIASPVNEPVMRPARPKHRVSIDGIQQSGVVDAIPPGRLELSSRSSSSSRRSSDASSDYSGGWDTRSLRSKVTTYRRPSVSEDSTSSASSDGVDRLEGEGTRAASVELNRIQRDGRWWNQYRIGNKAAVLEGERKPAEDGS
ncbi:MAG: hypothetical protein AAGA33_05790 [Pseudomonadota bacterium]